MSNEKGGPARIPKLGAQDDKKIGQILLEMAVITSEQLADAIATQQQLNLQGKRTFKVGEVLLFKNVITLPQLHAALRSQTSKADLSRNEVMELKNKFEMEKSAAKRLRVSKRDAKPKGLFSSIFSFLKRD